MSSMRKWVVQYKIWFKMIFLSRYESLQPRRHNWYSASAKRPITRWTRLSNLALMKRPMLLSPNDPRNTPCASETMFKNSPVKLLLMVALGRMWWALFLPGRLDDLLKLPRTGVCAGVCTARRTKSAGTLFPRRWWLWEDMEILEGGHLLVPWFVYQLVMLTGGPMTGDRRDGGGLSKVIPAITANAAAPACAWKVISQAKLSYKNSSSLFPLKRKFNWNCF